MDHYNGTHAPAAEPTALAIRPPPNGASPGNHEAQRSTTRQPATLRARLPVAPVQCFTEINFTSVQGRSRRITHAECERGTLTW